MPLEVTNESILPPGQYEGTIVNAVEGQVTYDPEEGPVDQVILTVKPAYEPEDGSDVRLMKANFSPVLNGLSKLSELLRRLGAHPPSGTKWDPASLVGTDVRFTAVQNGDFVNLDKDSIQAVEDSEEDS